MHTLPTRVENSMRAAAMGLTGRLREHAGTRGVPAELTGRLVVSGDRHHFRVGVSDPAFQDDFDDHEWGSVSQTPKAFVRTFEGDLTKAQAAALHQSVLEHLRTL